MKELYAALATIRDDTPPIKRNKVVKYNGKVRYPYVDYEQIRSVVDPLLKRENLLVFHTGVHEGGKDYQRTTVVHIETQQKIYTDVPFYILKVIPTHKQTVVGTTLVSDGDPQKVGISTTYFNRYGLISILGLIIVGEDTDGLSLNDKQDIEIKQIEVQNKIDSEYLAKKLNQIIDKLAIIPMVTFRMQEWLEINYSKLSDDQKEQINTAKIDCNIETRIEDL